jgi:membrane-bound metal-dependent hydrolase YbcI (DUF457 family)
MTVLTQPENFRIPRARAYTRTHTYDKIVCRIKYCIRFYSDTSFMIITPKSFAFNGLMLEFVSQYLTINKMQPLWKLFYVERVLLVCVCIFSHGVGLLQIQIYCSVWFYVSTRNLSRLITSKVRDSQIEIHVLSQNE